MDMKDIAATEIEAFRSQRESLTSRYAGWEPDDPSLSPVTGESPAYVIENGEATSFVILAGKGEVLPLPFGYEFPDEAFNTNVEFVMNSFLGGPIGDLIRSIPVHNEYTKIPEEAFWFESLGSHDGWDFCQQYLDNALETLEPDILENIPGLEGLLPELDDYKEDIEKLFVRHIGKRVTSGAMAMSRSIADGSIPWNDELAEVGPDLLFQNFLQVSDALKLVLLNTMSDLVERLSDDEDFEEDEDEDEDEGENEEDPIARLKALLGELTSLTGDSGEDDEDDVSPPFSEPREEERLEIDAIQELIYEEKIAESLSRIKEVKDLDLPGVQGNTLLSFASHVGNLALVKHLISAGASVDGEFFALIPPNNWETLTPIMTAASQGKMDVVKHLIANGASIDRQSNLTHYAPLLHAIQWDEDDIVSFLLAKGAKADPESTFPTGEESKDSVTGGLYWTPLTLAAKRSNLEVCEKLIAHGANVNHVNSIGSSPLKVAVQNSEQELVQLFLDNGADPDIADREGWTPLMNAANMGDEDIVRAILEAGPDLSSQNNAGETAHDLAKAAGHERIIPLLVCDGFGPGEQSNQFTPTELDGLEIRNGKTYQVGAKTPFTGTGTSFWANGKPKKEVHFAKGKLDGKLTWWYANGHKEVETEFKSGKNYGKHHGWHPNGQKMERGSYNIKGMHGLWQWWYEDGKLRQKQTYKSGQLHGKGMRWYEDGQMEEEVTRQDDEISGLLTQWYPNGVRKLQGTFLADQPHGTVTSWDEDGDREFVRHYSNGEFHGVEKLYEFGEFESERLWDEGELVIEDAEENAIPITLTLFVDKKNKVAMKAIIANAILSAYESNFDDDDEIPDFGPTADTLISGALALQEDQSINGPLEIENKLIITFSMYNGELL